MSEFSNLANEYQKSLLEYSPEIGLFWGKEDVALDRFTDISMEGQMGWFQKEDYFLSKLSQFTAKDFQNHREYTTFLLLKETLEARQASRMCREELWDINPARGWHNKMAIIASKQPLGTEALRAMALKRWRGFPAFVEKAIHNLKLGLELGFIAPEPAVARVLLQLNILLEAPIEDSPYFDMARRDPDASFQAEIKTLIQESIHPALKKYRDFLEQNYLPEARKDIGLSAMPQGMACYQAKLQEENTLSFTPSEIHAKGLKTVAGLKKEVAHIGLKKYGIENVSEVFHRAIKESSHCFSSEEDILQYNVRALEKAKAKIHDWFDLMPKAEGIIKPYPSHRAKTGASGEYYPPNEAGTTPGIFYINTYEPEKHSRIDKEATLYHELIPGHHFQIALILEDKNIPPINRYLLNAGFAEGWALYVERLADEMGLYEDDISRLGMLSNELLRASRLVVDTGIHAFHWSRQQAIDYLKANTALNEGIIEGEVDRYIMLPGQATAYMLGKNEISDLRALAQEQLGNKFDVREFHNQVLKNGMVTLSILRDEIVAWLRAKE